MKTVRKYIADLNLSVGDVVYNVLTEETLTISEVDNPQVGYTFEERANIQGEFMHAHWIFDHAKKE